MNSLSTPSTVITTVSELKKLLPLVYALEKIEITDDGSLYLKTKHHLIIESNGNQVIMYSKNGEIVIKSKMLHLNPLTPIRDVRNTADYVDRCRIDADDLKTSQITGCNNESTD